MTDVSTNFRAAQRVAKVRNERFDDKVREAVEKMLPYRDQYTREEFKCFILYILSQTTDKVNRITK